MKQCECGNVLFTAYQVCHHDVVVDGNNDFQVDKGVYDSKTPFGPYECTECGATYDDMTNIPEK